MKPTIYYFSGTHWDREWYQSFQGFRFRLVEMINDLMEGLEQRPDFHVFHLDGQTIVLEDYVEIEPERKDRLAKLIGEGRIVIGPWYVMPDEFLISGESIIRNLIMGRQISRQWGTNPWNYGYLCDIFGHIAQMPQIFNGFGIRHAMVGRGLNDHQAPAHFRWRSPDGSECVTFKLQDEGLYGAFLVAMNDAAGKQLSGEEKESFLKERIDYEMRRSPFPIYVLMDSYDHGVVRKDTGNVLQMIRRLYPEAEVRHVNLERMGLQSETYRDQMKVMSGELYEPAKKKGFNCLVPHTLSSRYPLKQANDECQVLLEKWLEPMAVISELEGYCVQSAYTRTAYKYLLQNHPHDSICGCSIDQVHRDMGFRFDQTKEICKQVLGSIFQRMRTLHAGATGGNTMVLSVWNPLPYAYRDAVTLHLDFPTDYPAKFEEPFGYELKNSFRIFDRDGQEMPYALVRMHKNYTFRKHDQQTRTVDRHTVSLELDLPAMGNAEYRIVPSTTPSRYLHTLSQLDRGAENEHIRFSINDNGTIRVENKSNRNIYDQLLGYLDDGEIGDGYYHVSPVEDRLVSGSGCCRIIERVENGPVRIVYRVVHDIPVPASLSEHPHGLSRSRETVMLRIESRIGLSKGARHVDVSTIVSNIARDHRLRLTIPTQIASPVYFVNQAFAFPERPTGIREDTKDWKERNVPEKPMGGIVGKRDADGNGLAFVSAGGLHECAAMDDSAGSLMVTLFRSFSKTRGTNGEEGGQLIGDLTFRYALTVLDDKMSYADLVRQQEAMQTGVYSSIFSVADTYVLPEPVSYFELISADICLSVLKRAENGARNECIVRCCNMSNTPSTATLKTFCDMASVEETDMAEEPLNVVVKHERRSFEIRMDAWKIQTWRIRWHGADIPNRITYEKE